MYGMQRKEEKARSDFDLVWQDSNLPMGVRKGKGGGVAGHFNSFWRSER